MTAPTRPTCRNSDPALFDSTDLIDHLDARRLCAICPLVNQCLHLALAIASEQPASRPGHRGPDGTWAGLLWRNGAILTTTAPAVRTAAAA
jgi:hypothetical protein